MSGSTEPQASLVFPKDQGIIMGPIDIRSDAIKIDELNMAFAQTPELSMRVARYSQPIREVQMVCNHPQHIIHLQ
jgi:hypothetical protein